jgi:hypothetical protein
MSSLLGFNNYITQNKSTAYPPTVDSVTGGSSQSDYPNSNLLDASFSTQMRRSANASITIDMSFAQTTVTGLDVGGIGAISIGNILFSGRACKVNVQLSNTAYGSSNWFNQTRMVHKSNHAWAPQNAIFVVDSLATDAAKARGGHVGNSGGKIYMRIVISDTSAAATIQGVGHVGVWQCMRVYGKEASLEIGGDDRSELNWPSAGYPFANHKAKMTTTAVTLTNLTSADIYGGSVNISNPPALIQPTIMAVNLNCGKSWPVLWIPSNTIATSSATQETQNAGQDLGTDRFIQASHVLGFMDQPIRARQIAQTDPDGKPLPAIWEAELSLFSVSGA